MPDLKGKLEQRFAEYDGGYPHLRELVDFLPVAIFEVDDKANLTFVNQRALEMFGYDMDDFAKGVNALTLLSPDDHERAVANIARALGGSYIGINEYVALKKDGSTFPALIHTTPKLHHGKTNGLRGCLVDISGTEKHSNRKKDPTEGQPRMEVFAESVSDWIWEVDTQGTYTFSNSMVKKILGYPAEAVVGRKFTEFMEPNEAARVLSQFDAHVKSESPFSGLENINIKRDGSRVSLETSGQPLFDEDNRLVGYRGIDRDITAWKQYEKQLEGAKKMLAEKVRLRTLELQRTSDKLAASEGLYRGLVETMSEGLIVTDETKRIVFVNPKLCQIVGRSEKEMLGKPFDDFLTRNEFKAVLTQFRKHPLGSEVPYEVKLGTKIGFHRWIRISPCSLQDSRGSFKGVLAVFSDITEVKEVEAELKEKSRFLEEANVALRVTLRKCDEERMELEQKVLANINELILPYLEKAMLKANGSSINSYLSILEANLKEIISPFSANLTGRRSTLTPREIQVADMIRHGKSTKEIATLLSISVKTVEIHRCNIRRKLGLKKSGRNLRSHLLSLA